MKKIDIHIHLTQMQMPRNGNMWFSSAENMLPHLDELGIASAVLMSAGEKKAYFASNDECRSVCNQYKKRYHWMCNVDPEQPETLPQRLESYKLAGAVGVGEVTLHRRMDDPFMKALFEAAQKVQLPVLMHMSPVLGSGYGVVDDPGLPLMEQMLSQYPQLIFIGHSQPFWHEISSDVPTDATARSEWGKGKVTAGGRLCTLLDRYPNLYADLSANSGGCALMRDEPFGLSFIERYQDRLMFGTDMFNVEMEFPLGKWLDKMLLEQKLSDQAYQKICRDNALRVFQLN